MNKHNQKKNSDKSISQKTNLYHNVTYVNKEDCDMKHIVHNVRNKPRSKIHKSKEVSSQKEDKLRCTVSSDPSCDFVCHVCSKKNKMYCTSHDPCIACV